MIDRRRVVELIIERHKERASFYRLMAVEEEAKAKEFEAYLYELNRPGFKSKGWHRMCKPARVEPYVVQAGETIRND